MSDVYVIEKGDEFRQFRRTRPRHRASKQRIRKRGKLNVAKSARSSVVIYASRDHQLEKMGAMKMADKVNVGGKIDLSMGIWPSGIVTVWSSSFRDSSIAIYTKSIE